jgi:hypothetical protein
MKIRRSQRSRVSLFPTTHTALTLSMQLSLFPTTRNTLTLSSFRKRSVSNKISGAGRDWRDWRDRVGLAGKGGKGWERVGKGGKGRESKAG